MQEFGKEVTRHPSGTGPYQFVSWSADTLKLKKNEHYWKPGLPKIDTITYRGVPENGARIAMLQTGEAQFIYPVPPEMIKSLDNSPTITVFNEPSILIRYVALNNMRKPFNDPRVRQALNYAIDKQAFSKVVFSGYCRSDGFADAAVARLLRRSRAAIRTIRRRRRRCWPRPAIRTASRRTLTGGIQHARRSAACSSSSSNSPRSA